MSIVSKAATLIGVKNLVTDSMAIDMGTARTIIAVRGRDVVLDEPSLVAVNELTDEIVAYGTEAYEMQGRETREVVVVAPLVGGVVADFERTKKMLAEFVQKARSGISHVSREAVMSVISEVTHVEQRALLSAAEDAKIDKVYMMEEGLAAAFGAGVDPEDKRASAVVDIGASTTNIAIVAKGGIVLSRSERMGSSDINAALINHIRRHRGLIIGEETAESLKVNFVTATTPEDIGKEISIRGLGVQTRSPEAQDITAGELYPIAEGIIRKVADLVTESLTELRPEVAADIFDRGIILTGGGALFNGIDQYMRNRTSLPVSIPESPTYATVHGLLKMFEEKDLLRKVARNEPHLLQNAEIPFEA